ncbi:OmpA family protein [Actinomadura macrotermitis]|uniref:OmpA family protein n=1 Tax=Actinomadura macrotermitis TaxID=2585200 RepID=UPI001886A81D|nr:OmpA family protein [Actinomadura macrotermitis]
MKALTAALALALLVSACGGDPERPRTSAGGGHSAAATGGTPTPGGPEPTSCPNGGQLIKAVEIPAVHADPVHIPEAKVGGQTVPAVTVPGVDIPAQRVPAQCVDIRPAPGGCLSAVTIPATSIPEVRVPGAKIPGVNVAGVKAEPVRTPEVVSAAVHQEQVHVDEVCQSKPKQEGEYVSSAYRSSAYRSSLYRSSAYRSSLYRASACNDKHECIPEVRIPSINVPPVKIPPVSVPSAALKSYTAGKSQVLKGDGRIAYNIEADVLFDFGKADIKPAAVAELAKVAASIEREVPATATVQVDGHTDAKGDPATNQALSEQRARAIVEWLATRGGISRDRLKATGYGETKPVAANTKPGGSDDPGGRAKNRRVVISAKQH